MRQCGVVRDGRRLATSGIVLCASVVACPFVVAWVDVAKRPEIVVILCAPAIALLGLMVLTAVQSQRGRGTTSFAARPLSTAALLMSPWVLLGGALGYFAVLLGLIVLPCCAAYLGLAWVQPQSNDVALTVVTSIAMLPIIMWFSGRADEYVREALLSGGIIAALVATLAVLRRRGDRVRTDA